MRRFLLALSIPCLVIAAMQWRLIATLLTVNFFPPDSQKIVSASQNISTPTGDQKTNELAIPTIGLTAPVIPSRVDPRQVTDWSTMKKDLTQGVSLAEKLSLPGQPGTTVITGHSSDLWPHRYAAIFAPLNRLETGDPITLTYQGQPHRYTVKEKRVVKPDDKLFSSAELDSPPDKNRLFLVTCWPYLTTAQRLVVIAE